jgi:hypothetical protein
MDAETPIGKKRSWGCLKSCLILAGACLILAYLFSYPVFKHGEEMAVASSGMQSAHVIRNALFDYSLEHGGEFSKAKSSTDVFQELLDGKYISDATTFYYPLPGKIPAEPDSRKLLAKNVGYDVTYFIDAQMPQAVPIVFLTGYKVVYQTGASAIPLQKVRSWSDWLGGRYYPSFIIECTGDDKTDYLRATPDGSIPDFIPADFDPKGKVYRQLTPDGELVP